MPGPNDEKAPDEKTPQTPVEKILEKTPKDLRPYVEMVISTYDTQLTGKDQQIEKLAKTRDGLKTENEKLTTNVNTGIGQIRELNKKLTNAEARAGKLYKKWPVQVVGGLLLLGLGAFGGHEYGQKSGYDKGMNDGTSQPCSVHTKMLADKDNEIARMKNDIQNYATFEAGLKGVRNNLELELKKYKSDNAARNLDVAELKKKLDDAIAKRDTLGEDYNALSTTSAAAIARLQAEIDAAKQENEKYKPNLLRTEKRGQGESENAIELEKALSALKADGTISDYIENVIYYCDENQNYAQDKDEPNMDFDAIVVPHGYEPAGEYGLPTGIIGIKYGTIGQDFSETALSLSSPPVDIAAFREAICKQKAEPLLTKDYILKLIEKNRRDAPWIDSYLKGTANELLIKLEKVAQSIRVTLGDESVGPTSIEYDASKLTMPTHAARWQQLKTDLQSIYKANAK